jgi:hypothetical protein
MVIAIELLSRDLLHVLGEPMENTWNALVLRGAVLGIISKLIEAKKNEII